MIWRQRSELNQACPEGRARFAPSRSSQFGEKPENPDEAPVVLLQKKKKTHEIQLHQFTSCWTMLNSYSPLINPSSFTKFVNIRHLSQASQASTTYCYSVLYQIREKTSFFGKHAHVHIRNFEEKKKNLSCRYISPHSPHRNKIRDYPPVIKRG